jgi:tRNA1(Val) A37 N6-methylase TrmN6
MPLKNSKTASAKIKQSYLADYPLEGSEFDVPLAVLMQLPPRRRRHFVVELLRALGRLIDSDEMALKVRTPFKGEMKDLRKLLRSPPDEYLFTDEESGKRWVLGKGSPGSSHIFWSRNNIWRMKTKFGCLPDDIRNCSPALIRKLDRLFDPNVVSKDSLRVPTKSVIVNALTYMQFDTGTGCAFPPFHAKFFADRYLPKDTDCTVVDPCAGWGGRLLGTLLVNRTHHVRYIGIDPEIRNRPAYEGLTRRVRVWLKREISGTRDCVMFYRPFEDWIKSKYAIGLRGTVDLVITSPPYFGAENYNPENPRQSCNRYDEYQTWRENFYRPLMLGAFDLLKPGGHFVLNIADVADAQNLERDARALAAEVGFVSREFFKLALSITPAARKGKNTHKVLVDGKLFKSEPVFVFQRPRS